MEGFDNDENLAYVQQTHAKPAQRVRQCAGSAEVCVQSSERLHDCVGKGL
jgi:hypothetical protein